TITVQMLTFYTEKQTKLPSVNVKENGKSKNVSSARGPSVPLLAPDPPQPLTALLAGVQVVHSTPRFLRRLLPMARLKASLAAMFLAPLETAALVVKVRVLLPLLRLRNQPSPRDPLPRKLDPPVLLVATFP